MNAEAEEMSEKPSKVIGQVLSDSYQVRKLIGEGGMGAVYEATHVRLPRRLAVKVLDLGQDPNPETMERFKQEAWITNDLKHPHIVNVCDFNKTPDGTPYFVMELLDGEDLESRLKRIGRFALDKVASILTQTASALEAAHNRGVVHRDLKPQNLYLVQHGDESDHVKILDFGISKVKSGNTMTRQRTVIGTPYYMAPEQARGLSSMVDRRTDVFATGVLLYEMIAGIQPFVGNSADAVIYQVVHEEPTPLSELRPEVNTELEAVVARAMAKKPDDRFPTMKALALAFVRALGQAASEREVEEAFLMLDPEDLEIIEEEVAPDDDTKPDMEYEIEPVVAPFSGATLPGQGEPRAPRAGDEDATREYEPERDAREQGAKLEDGAVVSFRPLGGEPEEGDAFDDAPTRAERPWARPAAVPWPVDEDAGESLEDLPVVQLPPVAVSTPPPVPDEAAEPGEVAPEEPARAAGDARPPRELVTTMQVHPVEEKTPNRIQLAVAGACVALIAVLTFFTLTTGSDTDNDPAPAPIPTARARPVVEGLPPAATAAPRQEEAPKPAPPPVEDPELAMPDPAPAPGKADRIAVRPARRTPGKVAPHRHRKVNRRARRGASVRREAARVPPALEPDGSDWVAPAEPQRPAPRKAVAARPATPPAAAARPAGKKKVSTTPGLAAVPALKVPRSMKGDAARGRSLFRSGCGRCHGKTAPHVKPTRYTSKQWSRFFARGKHRRRAPLAPHFRQAALSDVKAHLMANAADSSAGTAAGIR